MNYRCLSIEGRSSVDAFRIEDICQAYDLLTRCLAAARYVSRNPGIGG
jgi:hypothetical protein